MKHFLVAILAALHLLLTSWFKFNWWGVLVFEVGLVLAVCIYGAYPTQQLSWIPGPKAEPFSGNLNDVIKDGSQFYFQKMLNRYGPVVRIIYGREPIVLVGDVDLVRQIAVNSFSDTFHDRPARQRAQGGGRNLLGLMGDEWRASRRALMPAFNTRNLSQFANAMNVAGKDFVDTLNAHKSGEAVDIWRLFQNMTMQVISSTSFGKEISQSDASDNPIIGAAVRIFQKSGASESTTKMTLMFPWLSKILMWLPIKAVREIRTDIDIIHNTIKGLVKAQREKPGESEENNFISLLLNAQDPDTGAKLSDKEVEDESFLFLLAGYETTANALAFTIYLLARHEDAQKKVISEIDELCSDGDPAFEDLKKFTFLDMVMQESLRMYPPAPGSMRRTTSRKCKVGDYLLPKDTTIDIPIWAIHYDPKNYRDPQKFVPTRWDTQSREAHEIDRFAFMPFGEGPRKCVGFKFAQEEIKVVLIKLFQKYTFGVSDRSDPVKITFRVHLSPVDGVWVVPKKRMNDEVRK